MNYPMRAREYTLGPNFKLRNICNTNVLQSEIAYNYLSLGNNGFSATKT